MRRTTGSILPETELIGMPSRFISGIGAGHDGRRVDLGQCLDDGSTYSFVMRGLDPRIHRFSNEFLRAGWIAMTTATHPAPSIHALSLLLVGRDKNQATPARAIHAAAPCRWRSSAAYP